MHIHVLASFGSQTVVYELTGVGMYVHVALFISCACGFPSSMFTLDAGVGYTSSYAQGYIHRSFAHGRPFIVGQCIYGRDQTMHWPEWSYCGNLVSLRCMCSQRINFYSMSPLPLPLARPNCKRYFCMWSACTSCRPRTTSFHSSVA